MTESETERNRQTLSQSRGRIRERDRDGETVRHRGRQRQPEKDPPPPHLTSNDLNKDRNRQDGRDRQKRNLPPPRPPPPLLTGNDLQRDAGHQRGSVISVAGPGLAAQRVAGVSGRELHLGGRGVRHVAAGPCRLADLRVPHDLRAGRHLLVIAQEDVQVGGGAEARDMAGDAVVPFFPLYRHRRLLGDGALAVERHLDVVHVACTTHTERAG